MAKIIVVTINEFRKGGSQLGRVGGGREIAGAGFVSYIQFEINLLLDCVHKGSIIVWVNSFKVSILIF